MQNPDVEFLPYHYGAFLHAAYPAHCWLVSHREVLLSRRCALVWVDLFSTLGQHGNASGIQDDRAHGQDKGALRKPAALMCRGGRHLV